MDKKDKLPFWAPILSVAYSTPFLITGDMQTQGLARPPVRILLQNWIPEFGFWTHALLIAGQISCPRFVPLGTLQPNRSAAVSFCYHAYAMPGSATGGAMGGALVGRPRQAKSYRSHPGN